MACCPAFEPGRQTYQCLKYQTEMCDACLKCKDPELYCKYRSACLIHFMGKEQRRGDVDISRPLSRTGPD
jgi:hypothetical protein